MRKDSPTCDIEGLNILLSWVSCERLMVKSGDITNAYFQGCPLERLILMKQPPGGVPNVDISADTTFVAQYMAHVMLAVVYGRNFVMTFSALD